MPLDPTIWWLILTVIMPGQIPDIRYPIPEPSQMACETDLHEFLVWAKIPSKAQTVMAACLRPKDDEPNAKSTNSSDGKAG